MSDLQGGHEGELLEIEMQEFLDYLHKYDPNVWKHLDRNSIIVGGNFRNFQELTHGIKKM